MHQANYLNEAYRVGMEKIFDATCRAVSTAGTKPLALLQLSEDEENTAVVRFLASLWSNLQPYIEDIKYMQTTYDSACKPAWQASNILQNFQCVYSLYPKEWLVTEVSSDVMVEHDLADLKTIEPWWKLILGNKALLPLLWSMYPNHPSLLPAYYSDPYIEMGGANYADIMRKVGNCTKLDNPIKCKDDMWVSKPIFGREGAGIFMSHNFTSYEKFVTTTESNYGFDR